MNIDNFAINVNLAHNKVRAWGLATSMDTFKSYMPITPQINV